MLQRLGPVVCFKDWSATVPRIGHVRTSSGLKVYPRLRASRANRGRSYTRCWYEEGRCPVLEASESQASRASARLCFNLVEGTLGQTRKIGWWGCTSEKYILGIWILGIWFGTHLSNNKLDSGPSKSNPQDSGPQTFSRSSFFSPKFCPKEPRVYYIIPASRE